MNTDDLLRFIKKKDFHTLKQKKTEPLNQAFGRYLLLKEIGQGATGFVYLAQELPLQRRVAVKILSWMGEQQLERFKREGQLASKLNHPNIVQIHELGELNGRHYISMQYVEGQSMETHKADLKQALEIIKTIAKAVDHAHLKGVFHRDIKPSNILIDQEGRPYLTDFGIAKQIELTSKKKGQTISMTGMIIGTPAFMSPEQAQGQISKIDHLSDVYSIGATLYYMLTGKQPYDGSTVMEVVNKVINDPILPPRDINKAIPKEVQTIILKAMAKERERRYQSAMELAKDIDRFLKGEPITARSTEITLKLKRLIRNRLTIPGLLFLLIASMIAAYIIIDKLQRINKAKEYRLTAEQHFNKGELEKAKEYYLRSLGIMYDSTVEQLVKQLDQKIQEITLRQQNEKRARLELDAWLMMMEGVRKKLYDKNFRPAEINDLMAQLIYKLDYIITIYPLESAYYYRGKLMRERGEYDQAEEDLTEAIKLKPDFAPAYLERAKLRFEIFKTQESNPYLAQYYEAPNTVEQIQKDLKILQQLDFEGTQAKRVKKMVKILALLVGSQQDFTKANELIEELHRDYSDEESYLLQGTLYEFKNDYKQAIQSYSKAIDIRPTYAIAYYERGRVYLALKNYDDAMKDLSVAIALAPRCWPAYAFRSTIYMHKLDFESSIRDQSHAIEYSKPDAALYYIRAMNFCAQQKYDEALKDLDEAVRLKPTADIHLLRGSTKYALGMVDDALKDLDRASKLAPDNPKPYHVRGLIFFDTGDYKSAVRELSRAIELKEDPESYKFRGMAYYHTDDYKRALDDLTKASKLAPSMADELKNLIEDCRKKLKGTD